MKVNLNVANWLAFGFATFIVSCTLLFSYLILSPVDVLKNWQVRVDEKVYHPGEEVVVHVSYTKLENIPSVAYYYLECENRNKNLARYLMSSIEGNRPANPNEIGRVDQVLRIPLIVPDLPKRCRVAVSVEYEKYSFRKFIENNETNWFNVEEQEKK